MFKLGDRVVVKNCFSELNMKNFIGTIKHINENILGKNAILVEFDKVFTLGHEGFLPDCNSFKDGHCRWGSANELELYTNKHIFCNLILCKECIKNINDILSF